MEAMRCLKRRISDALYRHLLADTRSAEQPLAAPTSRPADTTPANHHPGPAPQPKRRHAGAVKVQRPTGRTTLTATSDGAHSKGLIPAP